MALDQANPRHRLGRGTRALAAFVVGVLGGLVGLVPWLLTGARLPLQNLWADSTPAGEMPHALLPFSQYAVAELVAMLGVGAVLAGLALRVARPHVGRGNSALGALGLVLVQAGAIGQTVLVVWNGLEDSSAAMTYLTGLTGIAVGASLLGLVAFLLVTLAPRGWALLGLTLGAVALPYWMPTLAPQGTAVQIIAPAATRLLQVLGPALVGLAIAWCGVKGWRLITACVALALQWVLPPALEGVRSALGSRAILHLPEELLRTWHRTFTSQLFGDALPALGIAMVVAAIGLAVRRVTGVRRRGA